MVLKGQPGSRKRVIKRVGEKFLNQSTMPNRNSFDGNDIVSPHYVRFRVENDKVCYILTGVFLTELKGQSKNWLRERLHMSVPIPVPEGLGLRIEEWAPYFTMNSVSNRYAADRSLIVDSFGSGHAVDSFGIEGRGATALQTHVSFFVDIAIIDSDAFLHRIGYNITLKGTELPLVG